MPLALGFYTYMAYKVTLIPYLTIISLFTWTQKAQRKDTRVYLVLGFLCFLISFAFLFNAYGRHTINRLNEVNFFPTEVVTKQADFERRVAIDNPLTVLFSNKAILAVKYLTGKYIGAFSVNNLFIDSEKLLRFHIYNHGHFYYLDLAFLLIGFCYLFAYKRKLWILFTSLILIAPLPSIVSNEGITYVMRSSLYIPFLYTYIGIGIWFVITLVKKRSYRLVSSLFIGGLYTVLIGNFLYTYFFIQPVYGSEAQAFSARVLSRYAAISETEGKPVTVVLNRPRMQFKDFIYYSGAFDTGKTSDIVNAFAHHIYSLGHVSFKTCEEISGLEKGMTYLFDPGEACPIFRGATDTLSIVQLVDSGTVYKIYKDSVCSRYQLNPFIGKLNLKDLSAEQLDTRAFCEAFIIRYSP